MQTSVIPDPKFSEAIDEVLDLAGPTVTSMSFVRSDVVFLQLNGG